jgi:hypothetical protein
MGKFDDALEVYAKYVIQQSRSNLTKKDVKASGSLYKSLGYTIKGTKVSFLGENYGVFQDQGVRGTEAYYSKSANSPYRFGTGSGKKFGLREGIAKWIKQKGIKGRDKKTGRFIKDKTLTYLIARSIYKKGIRATMFFTKPFEAAWPKYQNLIAEGFIEDNLKFEE